MGRASWNGFLRVSLAFWAVRLMPATTPTKRIRPQRLERRNGLVRPENPEVIEVDGFASPDEINPLFLDTPYYLEPDGCLAAEGLRAVGAAMTSKKVIGLGRIAERLVAVQAHTDGLLLTTLRVAGHVRTRKPGPLMRSEEAMIAIAEVMIERGQHGFSRLREHYSEVLVSLDQ
jgi:DNA end-binding protein Ku